MGAAEQGVSIGPLLPQKVSYTPVAFSDLPGWEQAESLEGFSQALWASRTFFGEQHGRTHRRGSWHNETVTTAFQKAFYELYENFQGREAQRKSSHAIKASFQKLFQVFCLVSEEVSPRPKTFFTGYYHPVIAASKRRRGRFQTPLYKRPSHLIVLEDLGRFRPDLAGIRLAGVLDQTGSLQPFLTRSQIHGGALEGMSLDIGWVEDPLDAFLMMVQGSGTLVFSETDQKTYHYDGTNGYPYTSIGKVLVAEGHIEDENCSLARIRSWCRTAPQERVQALFNKNESYVFFQESSVSLSPEGALEQVLIPYRSVAVDPRYIPMGAPLWVDIPFSASSEKKPYQGFAFAQDIGGAIKGPHRADLYCGPGQEAEERAGSLAHQGEMFVLLPRSLEAQELCSGGMNRAGITT